MATVFSLTFDEMVRLEEVSARAPICLYDDVPSYPLLTAGSGPTHSVVAKTHYDPLRTSTPVGARTSCHSIACICRAAAEACVRRHALKIPLVVQGKGSGLTCE